MLEILGIFFGEFESLGGNVAQPILLMAHEDAVALLIALLVEVVLTFL